MAEGSLPGDDGDATFGEWLKPARADAGWTKSTAIEAVAEVGVAERTFMHWESGSIAKPDPRAVRRACIRLGLDPRDAAVALGILTREELSLGPAQDPIHPTLRKIQGLLRATQVPQAAKDYLIRVLESAIDFWYQQQGVTRPPREPSAAERGKGAPVKPKR
jgi:transcriptional regulator with XRE-family HTH domain